jgi:hypothetical protein
MHCCCGYHHCHWHHGPLAGAFRGGRWRRPASEDYVEEIEEERGMLERRLRRLEREIEELRRTAQRAGRPEAGSAQ